MMGIEPTFSAWKADVLPLNHTRKCPVPESNQRHEDFQSSALPTELTGPAAIFTAETILREFLFLVKPFRKIFYCRSMLNLCKFYVKYIDKAISLFRIKIVRLLFSYLKIVYTIIL